MQSKRSGKSSEGGIFQNDYLKWYLELIDYDIHEYCLIYKFHWRIYTWLLHTEETRQGILMKLHWTFAIGEHPVGKSFAKRVKTCKMKNDTHISTIALLWTISNLAMLSKML